MNHAGNDLGPPPLTAYQIYGNYQYKFTQRGHTVIAIVEE